MPRITRRFSVNDGYNVGDFLHYGFDNVAAAELLLKTNARYFDAAGYLAHLGLELILKAWHLHAFDQFEEGHDLSDLWGKLQQHDQKLALDEESSIALGRINKYFTLRYPGPAIQEIGSDDLNGLLKLQKDICFQMPEKMHKTMDKLTWGKKGGRILMEKSIVGLGEQKQGE